MPELPEVTHITDVLRENLEGKSMFSILVDSSSRFHKDGCLTGIHLLCYAAHLVSQDGSRSALSDFTNISRDMDLYYEFNVIITRIYNKGKKIIFQLQEGEKIIYMCAFLALTGSLLIDDDIHIPRFKKMTFELGYTNDDMNVVDLTLFFTDKINYGNIYFTDSEEEITKHIGPDYWEVTYTAFHAVLSQVAQNRRLKSPMTIAKFLVEQKYFSGIGMYLLAEILYRACILPYRTLSSLSSQEIEVLFGTIQSTIQESYELGGYSFSDYIDPNYVLGKFETSTYSKTTDSLGNSLSYYEFGDKRTPYTTKIQK